MLLTMTTAPLVENLAEALSRVSDATLRCHLTLTRDHRWISLRCRSCDKVLLSATHLDLLGWLDKAVQHEEDNHAGQELPDDGPGCFRCEDS